MEEQLSPPVEDDFTTCPNCGTPALHPARFVYHGGPAKAAAAAMYIDRPWLPPPNTVDESTPLLLPFSCRSVRETGKWGETLLRCTDCLLCCYCKRPLREWVRSPGQVLMDLYTCSEEDGTRYGAIGWRYAHAKCHEERQPPRKQKKIGKPRWKDKAGEEDTAVNPTDGRDEGMASGVGLALGATQFTLPPPADETDDDGRSPPELTVHAISPAEPPSPPPTGTSDE